MFKVVRSHTEAPGSRAWQSGAPVSTSTLASNTQTHRLVLAAAAGAPNLCTSMNGDCRGSTWLHVAPPLTSFLPQSGCVLSRSSSCSFTKMPQPFYSLNSC